MSVCGRRVSVCVEGFPEETQVQPSFVPMTRHDGPLDQLGSVISLTDYVALSCRRFKDSSNMSDSILVLVRVHRRGHTAIISAYCREHCQQQLLRNMCLFTLRSSW